jgi:hypothetical protein
MAPGEHPATTRPAATTTVVAATEHAAPGDVAMAAVVPLDIGDRVTIVDVLQAWDARYRLMGQVGTVIRVDPRPRAPYVVRTDDDQMWAYGRLSLRPID